MSLIERAVDRLGSPGAEKKPLPERAVETARANETVAAIAPIAPASPSEPRPEAEHGPTIAADRQQTRRAPIRIELDTLKARGFVSPDGQASQTGQQFRVIKRPLLANAFGRGKQAIRHGTRVMVTSALPNEGKSFCAINLALSIAAERDHQVLLVDADVPRPSLPRELGIPETPGLMDWLAGDETDLRDLVRPTNVDKLSILQAGRPHEHATEMLASTSMAALLDRLAEMCPEQIVIFDSPPLMVTTEAKVLASHMGQIVLVVEAGKTPRDVVKEALSSVESCEIVGLILNKSNESGSGGYYGYGGYGYGTN